MALGLYVVVLWMLTKEFKDEPQTFNDEFSVVLLFNIVNPDTFNVDNMVVLLEVKVFEFNDDKTVVLFDIILYALTLYTPELLTFILYNKFRLKKISKLYYIMVQLYNPNVTGKQILIDTKNIDSTKLKLIENVQPLMEKIIQ